MTEQASITAIDLSGALPASTSNLEVVFPGTNRKTGWVVTFAGPSHPKTIAVSNENERKRLDLEARIEAARVNGRKWKPDAVAPEDSRREFVEGLVARIVGWTPVNFGWGVIEFSPKTAVDALLRPELGPYVAQFVDFLLGERSFMTDSAIS